MFSTDERFFVVAVSPSKGTKLVYELMPGATIELEYPDPGPSMWQDPIVRHVPPMPPRVTVEGTLLQGRMWQDNETFTPAPQDALQASQGRLEA